MCDPKFFFSPFPCYPQIAVDLTALFSPPFDNATAVDNYDGPIEPTTDCDTLWNTQLSVGSYSCRYLAEDISGNSANCSATISVFWPSDSKSPDHVSQDIRTEETETNKHRPQLPSLLRLSWQLSALLLAQAH